MLCELWVTVSRAAVQSVHGVGSNLRCHSHNFLPLRSSVSMKLYILSLLALASTTSASASWSKNLNYRSPSEHHPSLGISIHRVVKRNDPSSSYDAATLNFTHGVASGDPYPTSVILWTRVAPESDNSNSNVTVSGYAPLFDHDNEKYVSVSKSPICVQYTVASDQNMSSVVDSGEVYTSSDVDYTVKVRIRAPCVHEADNSANST
jgi:alkaline phosphatase D